MASKHMGAETLGSKVKKTKQKNKKGLPKVSKQSQNTTGELSLEDIVKLGGDKSDLSLVEDVQDDNEALDDKEDMDAEPIKKDEIRNFLKELDIRKHRPGQSEEGSESQKKKKEKPIKLAVAPHLDEVEEPIPKQDKPKRKENKNKFKVQDGEISSTTDIADQSTQQILTSRMKNYKSRKHSVLKAEGSWYAQHSQIVDTGDAEEIPEALVKKMEDFASKLLQDEVELYKSQRERFKKSETGWIKTVLTSGTLGDKMAALTLLVQDSPVHNLSSLDSLIAMAKKKGKRECILAVDTLKELFQSDLIPTERKLRTFSQNKLSSLVKIDAGDRDGFDRTVLLWFFESQLKERYLSFIKGLETLSFDTIMATKQSALSAIFNLLVNKPEQEKILLALLVNKVGDPDHKIASKSSHLLSNLVDRHPNMKMVVVKETEQLLHRPNISIKAQYYSICFLNQLAMSHSEPDLANRLIDVFFSFFKAFVKKGEVDNKIMSALLTGVNRVYPYAKVDYEQISCQMNTLYQIVHVVNFNTSLQALMLLYQVMDSSQSVSDRYFVALYKKLLDPALKTSSKQTMFLNLLFKSLRQDISEKRVKAFIKRLLQVCSYQTPQFTCASLILLSEVVKIKSGVLQLLNTSGKWAEDEDEERFVDLPDQEDEDNNNNNNEAGDDQTTGISTKEKTDVKSSWVHRNNLGEKCGQYNPQHRNPLYCCVDQECVWELEKLTNHYHPSVSLFAQTVLQNKPITYTGDPLHDFALIRFLDRFVYKNPKKQKTAAAQQPNVRFSREWVVRGVKKIPINSEEYIQREEKTIPVEEKFFYRYFKQRAEQKPDVKEKDGEEDSDVESVSDGEFEAFLDNYEQHVDGGGADVKFDFAGEFGKKSGSQKKKGKKDEGSSEDDSDDMDDLSDEEIDFGDDDAFKAAFGNDDDDDNDGQMDFDEEDVAFSDDDNPMAEFEAAGRQKAGKKRGGKGEVTSLSGPSSGKKAKKQHSNSGLFSAAEEFSHLLDENTGSKFSQGTTHALSNKDNADVKQLHWEVARDRKIRGADWPSKRRQKKKGPQKFSNTGKRDKGRKRR